MRDVAPLLDGPAPRAEPDVIDARVGQGILALRAGHLEDSMESSREVIQDAPDPKLRAAAWFNTGLICQWNTQAGTGMDPDCSEYGILQFLNAWSESPTADRGHKIVEVIGRMPSGCTVNVYYRRNEDYYLVQTGERATISESPQRLVVRHMRGSPPPADVAEFSLPGGEWPVTRRTYYIRQYDLSRVSVSVLQGLGEIHGQVRIRGQDCRFD